MGTHFLGGLNMRPVTVPDTAAYTVLAKNSGKVHILPDLSQTITMTLPAVEAGLFYKFISGANSPDSSSWYIATNSSSELFKGGFLTFDTNTLETQARELTPVIADFSNDDTLSLALVSPGTVIEFLSDGTSWLLSGLMVSTAKATLS